MSETEVKSNFDIMMKPPRKKAVRKKSEVPPIDKVEKPVGRPPKYAPTYDVKFAAYPINGSKINPDSILKSFAVIESSIMSISTPVRVFGNRKTDSGAKIIAQRSPQKIVFRETPDDELYNSLDFIASKSNECEIYIIITKKDYDGKTHTAFIYKGINLVNMAAAEDINFNSRVGSKYSYLNLQVEVGIVYEITTADVGDVKKYLLEKFGV